MWWTGSCVQLERVAGGTSTNKYQIGTCREASYGVPQRRAGAAAGGAGLGYSCGPGLRILSFLDSTVACEAVTR